MFHLLTVQFIRPTGLYVSNKFVINSLPLPGSPRQWGLVLCESATYMSDFSDIRQPNFGQLGRGLTDVSVRDLVVRFFGTLDSENQTIRSRTYRRVATRPSCPI